MTDKTKEALNLALEAFETLAQYNMVRANIFRRFEPTCTGDYVDLQEFREKAKPVITALREALAEESSGTEQPAQPQQEPVAYAVTGKLGGICSFHSMEVKKGDLVWSAPPAQRNPDHDKYNCKCGRSIVFYAPQRKPLTDEQIEKIRIEQEFDQWAISEAVFKYAARAIEAAHGIKGDA